MKLENLTGEQIRQHRRDWRDQFVDDGTMLPFHKYLEALPEADPLHRLPRNQRYDTDAGGTCCGECFSRSGDDYRDFATPDMCIDTDCDCHNPAPSPATTPQKAVSRLSFAATSDDLDTVLTKAGIASFGLIVLCICLLVILGGMR